MKDDSALAGTSAAEAVAQTQRKSVQPPVPVSALTILIEATAFLALAVAGVYQMWHGYPGDALLLAICVLVFAVVRNELR